MSADQDQVRLRHMLDAATKVVAFMQGLTRADFRGDEKLQLAIIRLLEIAGELPMASATR